MNCKISQQFPWIMRVITHQIFLLVRNWSAHVMWLNIPLKLGNIREYSPIFKTAHIVKKNWRIIRTIASTRVKNMLGNFFYIICFSWLTVFLKLHSWKTVHFLEQIMFADKHPSLFSSQMVTIVYISNTSATASWGGINTLHISVGNAQVLACQE